MDVKKHRARCVAVIGCEGFSARQIPKKPGINCAKTKLSCLRAFACTLHVIEDPADLCSGKIRIGKKSGLSADHIAVSVLFQLFRFLCRSSALPNDRIVYGRAALSIPNDGGFSLIGDSDARDALPSCADFEKRLGCNGYLRGPYGHRIVLNPSLLGENLRKFLLRGAGDLAVFIK